ncbi:helix-turn-helix domain-containing protein [Kitasatospora arboriphila]
MIGPVVPVGSAGDSLRWARTVRDRLADPHGQPVECDTRLPDLLLWADEPLVHLVAGRRLAPLEALTAKQAARVASTLLATLQTRGGAPDVAARLGIHPQTARKRLRRVHELFGRPCTTPMPASSSRSPCGAGCGRRTVRPEPARPRREAPPGSTAGKHRRGPGTRPAAPRRPNGSTWRPFPGPPDRPHGHSRLAADLPR